jgi:hypothetical protein
VSNSYFPIKAEKNKKNKGTTFNKLISPHTITHVGYVSSRIACSKKILFALEQVPRIQETKEKMYNTAMERPPIPHAKVRKLLLLLANAHSWHFCHLVTH